MDRSFATRNAEGFAIPRNKSFNRPIFKILEVGPLEPFHSKREAEVLHGEANQGSLKIMKDMSEVNAVASDRGHKTFHEVHPQHHDVVEIGKDPCKVRNIIRDRGLENGRLIRVEGGPKVSPFPRKEVKQTKI